MKTGYRPIESGDKFSHLFPKSKGFNIELKKSATLFDTVELMKQVISTTQKDTLKVAKYLKADSNYLTLSNIWHFAFKHLQYTKDELGKEQVRRPARTWADRKRGVDCDCMTVFIGSILRNLQIPFVIRLTKYDNRGQFEHVYPVALLDGKEVILDVVVHQFNYQVPFTQKKDVQMKLEFLNGFEDSEEFNEQSRTDPFMDLSYDAESFLLLSDDLEGLEGRAERQARKAKRQDNKVNRPPLKDRVKKGFHSINKVNPVTALLRAGILASMKLNVGKVARKLRYSYWTIEQAKRNNFDTIKLPKLIEVRQKLEKLFYGAGGKIENLRKAILEGKGNSDRKVALNGISGLGYLPSYGQSIQSIIGEESFQDEFNELNFGVNGLGEVVSVSAAIASASGIIVAISELLKKLGDLFQNGSREQTAELQADNTQEVTDQSTVVQDNLVPESITQTAPSVDPLDPANLPSMDDESEQRTINKSTTDPNESGGFIQWVKDHPLLSAGIVVVGVGGGIMAYKAYKKSKGQKPTQKTLSGVSHASKSKSKRTVAGGIKKVRLM